MARAPAIAHGRFDRPGRQAKQLVIAALEDRLSDKQAEQLADLDPELQKLAWLSGKKGG